MRHQLTLSALLLCVLAVSVQAKGWRGIVPLHSTRADVVRILGRPNLAGDRYELERETVSILYSDGPCRTGGWNVPKDTVIDIMTEPDDDLPLSDLLPDLSRFTKKQDYELLDAYHYTNGSEGFEVVVLDGLVRNVFYRPTPKDARLKCRGAARD
jgi:hypothetical protein